MHFVYVSETYITIVSHIYHLKFEKGNKSCKFIDGLADVQIAEAFAKHFRSTCTSLNNDQNDRLRLL